MNNILIIGVGGAGCNFAEYIQQVVSGRYVAINTDKVVLEKSAFKERLLIGSKACGGVAAHTVFLGERAAEESREELKSLISDSKLLIVFAGLGGGTGTAVTPIIVQLAQKRGLDVFVVVTLPFAFESDLRKDAAIMGLHKLKEMAVSIAVHDNEVVMASTDRSESLDEFFERINTSIKEDVIKRLNQWQSRNNHI